MTFGEKLKKVRESQNLSQTQLAEKIGTIQQSIYKYEIDKVTPSITVLEKIANALDVSADYLLGRNETPKSHKITPAEFDLLQSVKKFLTE